MTLKVPPIYEYGLVDAPGVVASNNFLSVFNPSASTVVHVPLEAGFASYSTAATQTSGSMAVYRITAASGGNLVSVTDVNKFKTSFPTPQCEVRTGNPTVTRVNNTPLIFKAPIVSTGGGNSGTVIVTSPVQTAFILAPGEGFVFNTAQGNVNQFWNMVYTWAEDRIAV